VCSRCTNNIKLERTFTLIFSLLSRNQSISLGRFQNRMIYFFSYSIQFMHKLIQQKNLHKKSFNGLLYAFSNHFSTCNACCFCFFIWRLTDVMKSDINAIAIIWNTRDYLYSSNEILKTYFLNTAETQMIWDLLFYSLMSYLQPYNWQSAIQKSSKAKVF